MNRRAYNQLYLYCNISLVTAAIISGLSFIAQKTGMDFVGPFTFNTLRCFIGFLTLLPIMFIFQKFTPAPKILNREMAEGGVFAGIILFMGLSINQYSMIYAQAGKAGFITSLYILFVPVITVLLKQKLKKHIPFSILLALAGLYLLCSNGVMHFEIWDITLLISAFFFALHIIVLSRYSHKSDPIKLAAIQFLTAGILSAPLMFGFEHPSLSSIIAGRQPILFIGIVVTAISYTLQIFGLKAAPPVSAAIILSSESIFAVIGGMLLLGETLIPREILGCMVMLAAIVISQVSDKKTNLHRPTLLTKPNILKLQRF